MYDKLLKPRQSFRITLYNHKGLTYRAPVSYVTKTWSVVLLNKKYIYCYLKCIMYDKLLKPRQSFRITLYNHKGWTYRAPVSYVTKTWSVVLLNEKIHILLSEVYCVWQVVKTQTIISNGPVFHYSSIHPVYIQYVLKLKKK